LFTKAKEIRRLSSRKLGFRQKKIGAAFIAIIVVSLLDPNKPSATMIETFDKVQHKLEDVKKQLA